MTDILEQKKHNQLAFHFLDGSKFKTNLIGLLIRTPLSRENATKTALLAEVLKDGCKAYPSRQMVSMQMDFLFGSVFDISILKKGDEQILFFYLEVLKNKEGLLEEGFSFLQQYIAIPMAENGSFAEDIVEREKGILIKKIQARRDDKREYAKESCIALVAKEEPFGIYADGYEEDIDKIDGTMLYEHYCKILEQGAVEILFCGDKAQQSKAQEMVNGFDFLNLRQNQLKKVTALSHKSFEEKKEYMDVAQGRLCMAFTSEIAPSSKEFTALLLANELLGGGATSLLFQRVREEQGLCYYINSTVIRMKSLLLVQTGIHPKDYEQTMEAVKAACNELGEGSIDEEQLENAKTSLSSYFLSFDDSPTALMNWKTDEFLLGESMSLLETCNQIKEITMQEVAAAAKKLNLSAVYFLCGKERDLHGDSNRK